MSLVSEALKKAEREAAAREAREKGLPAPLETPLQPYRARRGQRGRRALAPLAALLAGAAAVALVVFLARPGTEKPAASGREAGNRVSTPPAATSAPLENAESKEAPPSLAATEAVQAAASTTNATPVANAGPGATAPRAGADSGTREKPPIRDRGVREYVRRVDLPDGTKLELGGIAYSEAAPFAYLNGKLLAVGEGTAGYTLVRIERELVVVRGERGDLTLRLKPRPAG